MDFGCVASGNGKHMAIIGKIALLTKKGLPNAKTAGHKAWIEAHAGGDPANPVYKATVEGNDLVVTAAGQFRETLDLSGPDNGLAVLKELVAKGDLLTYETRVLFSDGKVLFGVPACTRLGKVSALVVRPARAGGGGGSSGASAYDLI